MYSKEFTTCLFFALLVYLTQSLSGQTPQTSKSDTSNYITYQAFFERIEKRYPVHIFYKNEWFENKKINSSFANLNLEEALSRVKRLNNLSYLVLDNRSYIFMPFQDLNNINSGKDHPDLLIIGDPNEFGKYTKATLTGKILDGKTGEPLPGAMLSVEKLKIALVTDINGNFSFSLPVGDHEVKLNYVGYEDNTLKIRIVGNGSVNFDLFERSIKINEVVVSGERAEFNISSTQMSLLRLNSKAIKELPVSMGETDIIKGMSLLPGIQNTGELGTGFNVRGGSADQNLILIEDVPLFNSTHMFGLTSTINADDVSSVTLLKSGIPARYGERASAVMDIRLGAENTEKIKAKGGIGLLSSRLSLIIPQFHNKATLMLGSRSSYSNWLLHKIPDYDLQNSAANFYDLDALYTIRLNSYNKFILFGYFSNDKFSFGKNTHYKYSSLLASVRWTHLFNRKLSSSLLTGISQYKYGANELDTTQRTFAYQINISTQYNNLKWNFSWLPNDKHSIDFGINSILYRIMPGEELPYGSASQIKPFTSQREKGLETALYVSDNFTISPVLNAELGLRFVDYLSLGPGSILNFTPGSAKSKETILDTVYYNNNQVIYQHPAIEPRIAFRYSLDDVSSLKLSYNRINQFIHLNSNNSVMSPTDSWMLSNTNIKPLISDQFALGYFRNFAQNTIEVSVETYYKPLRNEIIYKNGAQILLNDHIETDLLDSKGYNYGIEFYAKKNSGLITGWVSYTFSRSMVRTTGKSAIEQINNNRYFPSDFDKPHNVVVNANYHLSRRWRLSGTFTYNTGRPFTLPELTYTYQGNQHVYYSDRNKYRLPDYHRLDIAITFDENLRVKKMWKGSWSLSIINVYARKNVYTVYYAKQDPRIYQSSGYTGLYMIYIIGIPLPTLTYNFTF